MPMNSENINNSTLIDQDSNEFAEIESFIENKIENRVISSDGLCLSEVFQVLVQMLNGDLKSVKKALKLAEIMVEYGLRIMKESQPTKADIRRALAAKESYDFVKSTPVVANVKSSVKKKGRGI